MPQKGKLSMMGSIVIAMFLFMVFPDSVYAAQGSTFINPGHFYEYEDKLPRI